MRLDKTFADLSSRFAHFAGRPATFIVSSLLVAGWALSGFAFHYSDTWQLVMNTISSVVTFLMVFLIQNTQARDSEAVQAKLDSLIAAIGEADQRLIAIEKLPDQDIERFRRDNGPDPGLRAVRRELDTPLPPPKR